MVYDVTVMVVCHTTGMVGVVYDKMVMVLYAHLLDDGNICSDMCATPIKTAIRRVCSIC